MKHYEAPESVKYHGGYDPSDPPQGERWCSECSRWDDECECEENTDDESVIESNETGDAKP